MIYSNNFITTVTSLLNNILLIYIINLSTSTKSITIKENHKLKNEINELKQMMQTIMAINNNGQNRRIEKFKTINKTIKKKQNREIMTFELYYLLIGSVIGSDYKSSRLKVAIFLLFLTGVRISTLLPLQVKQILPLLKSYSIATPEKRPNSNGESKPQKAFLTDKGKKLLDERKKDFEIILKMKKPDSYLFTSQSNHEKMLSRETLTKEVNNLMQSVGKILPDQPNITSRNFRASHIFELWENSRDIKFVRQAIGDEMIAYGSSNGDRVYYDLNGHFVTLIGKKGKQK